MSRKNGKKKQASKKNGKKHEAHPKTSETLGLLVLALAFIITLSLICFSLEGAHARHWLGLVGFGIGWAFNVLFGLPSYFICLYLAWIGWRLLFKKPIRHLALKTLYASLFAASACILLSLLEDTYPAAYAAISSNLFKNALNNKERYHLGGTPFYYVYREMPFINLVHIFNSLGIAIIFTTTSLASILMLCKTNPFVLIEKAAQRFKDMFSLFPSLGASLEPQAKRPEASPSSPPIPEKKANAPFQADKETESDFLRYVKLRIPGTQPSAVPQISSDPSSSSNDMLAIQPETNLKARPSLSRKEQADTLSDEEERKQKKSRTPELTPPFSSLSPYSTKAQAMPAEKTIIPKQRRETALAEQRVFNGDFSGYKLPPASLLTTAKKADHSSLKKDLKRKAEVLEETLLSFGIEAKVGQINCGPTITSFEVHPAIGVKVQKIKTLENDIALNMEAKSIRIIAPIPGKAAVGIEVPNTVPEEVGFKDMLGAYQNEARKFHIPILLGKAVNGDFVMSDLTKMPHCIIAGATGSGKSVCINTIVMSILMNARPDQIKLLMVDPKKVELTPYTTLPHMLAPVITQPEGAYSAMIWLVKEMEKRYDLLKQIGARNIEAFNTRTVNQEFEATLGIEIPNRLPYIIGIVDELADLMMVSNSDIETPIARIAQMARAVGIHLILATQRPSREVITGLIKANFPTRISFKVSSRVNSQIVLDDTGAESLLGNGDMLFLPPGASNLVRAQGAFIRDEDINRVVKFITDQAPPNYAISSFDNMNSFETSAIDEDGDSGDALYSQALDVVLGTGNASTTFLQRKLKIGYARAASLIDMLERKGVVGPADGSKPRKILVALQGKHEEEGL